MMGTTMNSTNSTRNGVMKAHPVEFSCRAGPAAPSRTGPAVPPEPALPERAGPAGPEPARECSCFSVVIATSLCSSRVAWAGSHGQRIGFGQEGVHPVEECFEPGFGRDPAEQDALDFVEEHVLEVRPRSGEPGRRSVMHQFGGVGIVRLRDEVVVLDRKSVV